MTNGLLGAVGTRTTANDAELDQISTVRDGGIRARQPEQCHEVVAVTNGVHEWACRPLWVFDRRIWNDARCVHELDAATRRETELSHGPGEFYGVEHGSDVVEERVA